MKNWTTRIQFVIGFVVLLSLTSLPTTAGAESKSSCENCHLDEEMLLSTLKVDTSTQSAMQSGAG